MYRDVGERGSGVKSKPPMPETYYRNVARLGCSLALRGCFVTLRYIITLRYLKPQIVVYLWLWLRTGELTTYPLSSDEFTRAVFTERSVPPSFLSSAHLEKAVYPPLKCFCFLDT